MCTQILELTTKLAILAAMLILKVIKTTTFALKRERKM